MNRDVALIVGNGTSRKNVDLRHMVSLLDEDRPVIYGCNAIYREFQPTYDLPDYVIAIDDGIMNELQSSGFPKEKILLPLPGERWEPEELHPNGNRPRSNAGMCAMKAAIRDGAKTLLCIGFDSFLFDREQSVSNLFDGTDNYGPETRASEYDNPGRIKFMKYLAGKNPTVDFIFIYPDGMDAVPIGQPNTYQVTYEELLGLT